MDDNGNSVNKPSTSEHDKYLVPWETEAQLQLLWRFNSSILDFIWGRAMIGSKGGKLPRLGGDINDPVVNCGWKIFFSRCVLVPPSRFRPASKVGDAMTEHPQVGPYFDFEDQNKNRTRNRIRITDMNNEISWFWVDAMIFGIWWNKRVTEFRELSLKIWETALIHPFSSIFGFYLYKCNYLFCL